MHKREKKNIREINPFSHNYFFFASLIFFREKYAKIYTKKIYSDASVKMQKFPQREASVFWHVFHDTIFFSWNIYDNLHEKNISDASVKMQKFPQREASVIDTFFT